jgi:hypothetical protein
MRIYDCQRVEPSSPIKYLLPNLKRARERERAVANKENVLYLKIVKKV